MSRMGLSTCWKNRFFRQFALRNGASEIFLDSCARFWPAGVLGCERPFTEGRFPGLAPGAAFATTDKEAFLDNREYRAAVDRFGDAEDRIALAQTHSHADAEDVMQTVFLKLYTKAPENLAGDQLKYWLIRVTVNECRSFWRNLWHRRVDLRDIGEAEAGAFTEPAFEAKPHEELYQALGCLPEKCRVVVHLFYFEDMSCAEIAAALGIKEPTVRTRLVRARKMLKQQLKEAWEDEQSQPIQSHDGRSPCSC